MSKDNTTKTYFVKGMHCPSCEILIEKELSRLGGVKKANVSLRKNCVEIHSEHDKVPSVEKLNKTFGELGYTFHNEKPKEEKLTKNDVKRVLAVFLTFILIFYLLEKSGIFMRLSVTPNSSAFSYFMLGILAGLSSCAALVGGVLLTLSTQWNTLYNGNTKKSAQPFVFFNLSRVLAFAIFGGLLGLLGSAIQPSITFASFLTLGIAVIMLAIGFQMIGISWFKSFAIKTPKVFSRYISDETNFKGKYMPVAAGALTFFVPCGFTFIAQTNALGSGSVLTGALMLTSFSLGTLPILSLISFSSVKLYNNPTVSKKFNLFSGLLIAFFALYTFNSQLNVLGYPSLNDLQQVFAKEQSTAKVADIIGDTQLVQIEAVGFEYYPSQINLRSHTKTRLEVFNSGATGCAQALYAKELYPDVVYLKDGLNVVEFTSPRPGTYKISCSMGMVPPVTVNVF